MTYFARPLRAVRRRILSSAVLFMVAAPVCLAKQDNVPAWVLAAAAQKLPTYPAETNAVILLDDTTYSVAPNGQAMEHYRRVIKILRPQGLLMGTARWALIWKHCATSRSGTKEALASPSYNGCSKVRHAEGCVSG